LALINVYLKAAKQRQLSKATKSQLKNAKSALSQWTHVLQTLERVTTDGRSCLRMLLEDPPLDDNKGERELNEFASSAGRSGWMRPRPLWHFSQPLTRRKISRPMLASGPSGFERWSKLLPTGGSRSEAYSLRLSMPIGAMMGLQSCMAVMALFSRSRSRCFVQWMCSKSPRSSPL